MTVVWCLLAGPMGLFLVMSTGDLMDVVGLLIAGIPFVGVYGIISGTIAFVRDRR